MEAAPLYLDHAATTPLRPEVAEVMARAGTEAFANPSSQHAAGRRAKYLLEDARDRILAACSACTAGPARDRLVFTSGASEANRLAVLGLATASAGAVATSARDHASLRLAAAEAAGRGWHAASLPLDAAGRLDRPALDAWITGHRSAVGRLLVTTLVCGQTGTIEDIAAAASAGPARLHTDATQAVLTEDVSFAALPVASMTLAPHKFGGPRGIGALVVRHGHALAPLQPGTQEMGMRGGTEAVALAAGFARAMEMAVQERAATRRRLQALRDRFEAGIARAAADCGIPMQVIGDAVRAPHISTITLPGRDRQALVMAADLAGLCCSTGSACSSGSSEPAPALLAMRLPSEAVRGAVRFSFGVQTTEADVDRAIALLGRILAHAPGMDSPS